MTFTGRLLFSYNALPELPKMKKADLCRIALFRFEEIFGGDTDNKQLLAQLTEPREKSRILNLLLKEARKIIEGGGLSHGQSEEDIKWLWQQHSNSARQYGAEQATQTRDGEPKIKAKEVYEACGGWIDIACGDPFVNFLFTFVYVWFTMLERLFTSKSRVRILEQVLLNPDAEYHIRKLSRVVGVSPVQAQKELSNLQSLGLLKSRREGNMVLYRSERRSPIWDDLKRIFLKTESVGQVIREGMGNDCSEGIKYAAIYGSVARGTETATSDVDMLVVGDNVNEDSVLYSIAKIEKNIGREINISIWTEKEFRQKSSERIPLIREILKTPIIMTAGDKNEFKRSIKKEFG